MMMRNIDVTTIDEEPTNTSFASRSIQNFTEEEFLEQEGAEGAEKTMGFKKSLLPLLSSVQFLIS